MEKSKTIHDAVVSLPEEVRQTFVEIFESLGIMDIYDGDLKSYFLVVAQDIKRTNLLSNKFRQALWLLHENSDPKNIERGVSKLV